MYIEYEISGPRNPYNQTDNNPSCIFSGCYTCIGLHNWTYASVGLFQDNKSINRMLIVAILSKHITANGQKYYDSKALKGSLCIW